MLIVPGGASTKNLIDKEVLEALGPRGVVINMARGSVVDEQALIEALRNNTILSAGLDVYPNEPHVAPELICFPTSVRPRSTRARKWIGLWSTIYWRGRAASLR
jgi:lactate dehydrogenase-like 2-hydroxyacid dehydrogenase